MGPARDDNDGARSGALAAATGASSAPMQAQDVYEWLVRRRAQEVPVERILNAIRTAAGIVPLGGRAPLASASTALISSSSGSNSTETKPEDVFVELLLTCVELPASVGRDAQRSALHSFLQDHRDLQVPTASDDSAAWWAALAQARAAYFAARRAFFLVRMELLRVALFQSRTRPHHPHASVVTDVVNQLVKDGLVLALLEELGGRDKLVVPAFYAHVMDADLPLDRERHLRHAQHAWEAQLLSEDELLRELLVLALQFTHERVPLARSTQVIEHLLQWPAVVVPELFSQHSLAVPLFQRTLRRVTALGSVVTLQLLHRASQATAMENENEAEMITQWSRDFVVAEAWRAIDVDDHHVDLCEELTESGVLLVAWATLLAKLYRRSLGGAARPSQQLEQDLQTVLKASEDARGFQQVRDVLRRLVFDNASPSQFAFLKSTQGMFGATSWELPPTAENKTISYDDATRVAVFQVVGATFLDDALSALGYVEHVEEEAQLNAMVKLIRPVLANHSVTEAVLQKRPMGDCAPEFGSALSTLLDESRAAWPQNLLPGLRVLTALCCGAAATSQSSLPGSTHTRSPSVQLTLKELATKRQTTSSSTTTPTQWRRLPPDEFLEFIPEQELVICKKAFAYADEGDRVLVAVGTKGALDQDDQGREVVQWQLEADEYHNAWETLLSTLETLVDQIQSQPLITIDSSELETFTAFLELVVQVANSADASSVLTQVMQQWAHARLKQWWQEMGLPNGASSSADDGGVPAVLFRNKVSLRVLQSASREDLVAWGVHDRFLREQILARIAFPEGASSAAAHQQRRAASRDELEKDGLSHLVRMLLGFLDGFVNEHAVMAEQDDDDVLQWTPKQLHFVTAILAVLAKLTSSLDLCIDVLVHELGGGTEECVQLILKSTRKLFEYHESTAGSYSGLFASLTLLMNMSRWCVAHEAIGGVASGGHVYRATEIEFRAAERHWLIATVEFIMEIVATHETWRFVAIGDKWALLDRCYRILTALLTARFYHGESDGSGSGGLRDFQNALRNTLVADKPLLMKLLRSASRLVATKEDAFGNDARAFALAPSFERSDENGASLYPFTFEQEVANGTAGLLAREALVASSLRLLDLVMEQSGASSTSNLMTPIDGDGLHERPALNLVTLAGGYLAYPLSKNAEIASISLKLLRRAVDATSTTATGSDAVEMENRSLVTLFRETSDLEFIRDTLLDRVRSPGATGMLLRKELLDLLTSCLDNQPGFFAVLVLDEDIDSSSDGGNKTKRLVAIVERFLESSDKLLETHTDVLCSILRFLRRIWLGGINERRTLHLQIASALRKSSRFWKHLTQVLRIRLPLSMDSGDEDDEWPVALDQDDDAIATEVKSIGRSGVFASLARGMILEIVACEWHHYCSKAGQSGSHPLVAVLDAFREEGLYAHWLRTFTRLDYNASRFAEVANSVQQYVVPFPPSLVSSADNSETVLAYHESVVAALLTLRWQLGPATKRDSSDSLRVTTTWKRAKWSALASAQAAAQIHALGRWKTFMELYALQPGGSSTDDDHGDADEAPAVSSTEHRKRKESMIATPPRTTARENTPVSPRHPSGSLSSFSGDRTSYGIVQVLSATVLIQIHRHERDQERGAAPHLDVLSLTHLQEVVELLVAMLHHQTRVVVRKTRDPKLSATRARDTSSTQTSRLTVVKSLELLALVEKATRQVMASGTLEKKTAGHSSVVDRAMASAGETSQASLWAYLAGSSYEQELDVLTKAVRTSLFTAALLLTRHVTAQHASGGVDHTLVQRAVIVQVKLTQHAIESIQLCDRAGADHDTSRLFQVSWSLLQALLDEFTTLTVAPEKQKFKLDAILSIGPLVTLLQHETSGFCALVEIVTERFQPTIATQQPQRLQACAVLRGLTAVVWNPTNAELCRHVMLAEDSVNGFSLLRFFATKLVPRLRDCLAAEQGVSHSRGYVGDDAGAMERSPTHLAWCSVLMIAAGLVRQMVGEHVSVWEFVASAEPLLAAALSSSTHRLTRATVEEQACVMTLLNALSASRGRRKQWRERLPTNCVVLMEQSRIAMRRACVLLGNSSYTAARQREQQHHAQLQKKPRRLSVTAWPLSTSPRALAAAANASLTFAHQTLLHEQLEATTPSERRHVTSFYKEMESKLVHVVEQGAHLLLKWTPSVASRAATVALDGTKFVDDEQLTPLLALVVPSDSLTLACVPSLGHLCIAMEFCVEQLKQFVEKQRAADHRTAAIVNTLQTSALLFLQTYLLHADQQPQTSQSDFQDAQKDFGAFFEQLIDELNESPQVAARVDVAFLQQILMVVQLQAH